MASKSIILAVFALLVAMCSAGIVPAAFPAAYVAPYASTYNAHVVNHAIAAPVAAPVIAAPAHVAAYPHLAYSNPLVYA